MINLLYYTCFCDCKGRVGTTSDYKVLWVGYGVKGKGQTKLIEVEEEAENNKKLTSNTVESTI